MSDFGPKITIKIVESLRDDIYAGKLKSGTEIKAREPFSSSFCWYTFSDYIVVNSAISYLYTLYYILGCFEEKCARYLDEKRC